MRLVYVCTIILALYQRKKLHPAVRGDCKKHTKEVH